MPPPPRAITSRLLAPAPMPKSRSSICSICCRAMEISCLEKDSWKSYHQPLGLESTSGNLVPAQKHLYSVSLCLHSCCWELAKNVLDFPYLDQDWLISFTGHLVRLRPFVKMTPFDCETHDVDHELSTETHLDINNQLES